MTAADEEARSEALDRLPDGALDEEDLRRLPPDVLEKLAAGRRRAREGSRRKRRPGPRPVRELMGGLLEKWGVAESLARARVFQEWEDRVGQEVARRARPVGFDGGTLFVEVESASWLSELRMMKRQLIQRVNAGRKRGRVEEIVFVQGGRDRQGRRNSTRDRQD